MKKIFVISNVKNEEDIIESFCRYNLTYSDGMLICDRGSTDNTLSVIKKMIEEGLPIYIVPDPQPGVIFQPAGSVTVKTEMARVAVDKFNADVIVPLDADELLYHVDGVNPRETLETLYSDMEYRVMWRTYIYESESYDSKSFFADRFTSYRNPKLEYAMGHAGTTIASRRLIREQEAVFVGGAHWMLYPDEVNSNVMRKRENNVKILDNLVCAHFPIRSEAQVLKQTIPRFFFYTRDLPPKRFGNHQFGTPTKEFMVNGKLSAETLRRHSIEYSLFNLGNKVKIVELMDELKEDIVVGGALDLTYCREKIALRYGGKEWNDNAILKEVLTEAYGTIEALHKKIEEKAIPWHLKNMLTNSRWIKLGRKLGFLKSLKGI